MEAPLNPVQLATIASPIFAALWTASSKVDREATLSTSIMLAKELHKRTTQQADSQVGS